MSLDNDSAQSDPGTGTKVFVDFLTRCRRCKQPFVIPIAVDWKAEAVYVATPVPVNCKQISNGPTVCPHCSAPYGQVEEAVRQVRAGLPSAN
jgi:hypothetical protein